MLTEFMLSFEEAKLLTTTKIPGAISKLLTEQNKARTAKQMAKNCLDSR